MLRSSRAAPQRRNVVEPFFLCRRPQLCHGTRGQRKRRRFVAEGTDFAHHPIDDASRGPPRKQVGYRRTVLGLFIDGGAVQQTCRRLLTTQVRRTYLNPRCTSRNGGFHISSVNDASGRDHRYINPWRYCLDEGKGIHLATQMIGHKVPTMTTRFSTLRIDRVHTDGREKLGFAHCGRRGGDPETLFLNDRQKLRRRQSKVKTQHFRPQIKNCLKAFLIERLASRGRRVIGSGNTELNKIPV